MKYNSLKYNLLKKILIEKHATCNIFYQSIILTRVFEVYHVLKIPKCIDSRNFQEEIL